LKEYLHAPAPASYVISVASETPRRADIPAWAIALLSGLVVFALQRGVSTEFLASEKA